MERDEWKNLGLSNVGSKDKGTDKDSGETKAKAKAAGESEQDSKSGST